MVTNRKIYIVKIRQFKSKMSFLKKLSIGILCAASMLAPASSYAKDIDVKRVHITSCVNDEPCTEENKDVRIEDRVRLNLVVEADIDGRKTYFSESDDVELNGRRLKTRKPGDLEAAVRWYKVEPAKNSYNNMKSEKFSWDTPSYTENLIWDVNSWTISADAHPTNTEKDVNGGAGTMRYKAEIVHDGKVYASPGKESKNKTGVNDKVHRITFRNGDDFVGWLSAYFNVPYIYGSAGANGSHQTDRFVGADCADLVIGACRKSGGNLPYTNASGLKNFSDTVVEQSGLETDDGGFYRRGGRKLGYGTDVKTGDLILFGDWHVGVLMEDANANGVLDRDDLMLHTLFNLPNNTPIWDYNGFSVLRLKCR